MVHSHLPHDNSGAPRGIAIAFWLNTIFVFIEIAGGLWTNSVAILADALHDAMDSLSLGLAWYLARVGSRAPDDTFTYGYKRYTLLSALITGILIIVGQLFIISEAVPRFWNPVPPLAEGMLALAVLGIGVNAMGAWIVGRGSSLQEKMLSWHLLEDVLGWVAVLAGSLLILQFGWHMADPLLAVGIALYVIVQALRHLKKVVPILMQSVPEAFDQKAFITAIESLNGVQSTHDLHVWSLEGERLILSVHVVVGENIPDSKRMTIRHEIEAIANRQIPTHTTVEIETPSYYCPHEKEKLSFGENKP